MGGGETVGAFWIGVVLNFCGGGSETSTADESGFKWEFGFAAETNSSDSLGAGRRSVFVDLGSVVDWKQRLPGK